LSKQDSKQESKKTKKIIVYTDGGCRGNPGPGGWGVVFQWGFECDYKATRSGSSKDTTNNKMELMAAIQALLYIEKITEEDNISFEVDLHTDSTYVKQGITQWIHSWKKKNWRNSSGHAVKNQELWKKLDEVSSKLKVNWFWVKGHSGHPGNDHADRLANAAMDRMH
jgi:ribonuclease HI